MHICSGSSLNILKRAEVVGYVDTSIANTARNAIHNRKTVVSVSYKTRL